MMETTINQAWIKLIDFHMTLLIKSIWILLIEGKSWKDRVWDML
jgi:hypothetical protein